MNKSERGLTLIEVLVTVTILSFIGVLIWNIFFQGVKYSHDSVSKNQMQQEANIVVTYLTKTHQISDKYTVNNSSCKIIVNSDKNGQKIFENSQLCYSLTISPKGLGDEIDPNKVDLSLKLAVYEKNNKHIQIAVDTLLYRIKGDS
jgi:prepilin-type N-terminal cleavage/methylation domain-containing protein